MTLPSLPVSRLINVAVNLTPKAASAQNLSTLLILGSTDVIDVFERYRSYTTISQVAADFGTSAPEYLAAVLWFEQQPQPTTLLVGRWAKTATSGILRGAVLSLAAQALSNFTGITNGRLSYAIDGGARADSATINLSGVANLSAVAALISAQVPGAVITWNAVFQRFEAKSNSTGAVSAVAFMQTPGSGTDLSALIGMQSGQSGAYNQLGVVAETALQCVSAFDIAYGQMFYGLTILGATDSDHLAVGPFIDACTSAHIYFVTTQSAGVLVASYTADIAYQLQLLGLLRTFVQYSSTNPYAAVSAAARMLTTDYAGNSTVITLFYKQEPGIVAESLNQTQIAALEAKNANVFVNYNNNTAILEPGTNVNGTFLDIVTGTDWLKLTIQTNLYNLLYTSPNKIPQTDSGMNQILNQIEAACAAGVANGLLAPGVWQSAGFGILSYNDPLTKGYYVYVPKISTQTAADRQLRKTPPFQVAAKLAGAVHSIGVIVNVNL